MNRHQFLYGVRRRDLPRIARTSCYYYINARNSQITMIQGWDWYAGADPRELGAGQFDIQTPVTHELGHALGLGGGTDPSSPMYETLTPGTIARTVTVADLNIPDPPDGADPQSARASRPVGPTAVLSTPPSANERIMVIDAALASGSQATYGRFRRIGSSQE